MRRSQRRRTQRCPRPEIPASSRAPAASGRRSAGRTARCECLLRSPALKAGAAAESPQTVRRMQDLSRIRIPARSLPTCLSRKRGIPAISRRDLQLIVGFRQRRSSSTVSITACRSGYSRSSSPVVTRRGWGKAACYRSLVTSSRRFVYHASSGGRRSLTRVVTRRIEVE
jgi:hypothetical protein